MSVAAAHKTYEQRVRACCRLTLPAAVFWPLIRRRRRDRTSLGGVCALQTLRELQKAKHAIKKAQKEAAAIKRSRYKLKQAEKEAAAAAEREHHGPHLGRTLVFADVGIYCVR